MRSNTGSDDLSASLDSELRVIHNRSHLVGEIAKYPGQQASVVPGAFPTGKRDAEGVNTEEKWYALQVRPRFEKVVAVHLNHKGYEEYLPLYRSRRRWSDRIKEIELPLFPGYIFCKFDVLRRLPILLIPGVISVVGTGKNPLAVSDDEINAVQNVVKSGLTFQPSRFIATGQLARVERGPLRGLVGIVIATKKNCRLIVSINLLQRSVSVEVDSDSVMPVSVGDQQAVIAGV
jgi:transcription antitermination factor NusG